jgi:hypothetical protein
MDMQSEWQKTEKVCSYIFFSSSNPFTISNYHNHDLATDAAELSATA